MSPSIVTQNSQNQVQLDPVWQKRWDSQYDYLTALADNYSGQATPIVSSTLATLVTCLKEFVSKQIAFFIDNFSQGNLEVCNDFPPEAVLSAILDQVGFDISLIERIAEQRQRAYTNPNDPYAQTLAVGDHLADEALQIARDAGLFLDSKTGQTEPVTVLTYFRKSAVVRIIPYAPIVLVGIPYTCLDVPRDFLAIPHEIGHYVYRFGIFRKLSAGKSPAGVLPANINDWVKPWFEEIFADVYGALVAGPVIGLDFQDLQMSKRGESFYEDDDVHPVPLLRPYLYINTLSSKFKDWANELLTNWNANKQKRSGLPFIDPETGIESIKLKNGHWTDVESTVTTTPNGIPTQVDKPLDKAVTNIQKELLAGYNPGNLWAKTKPLPAPNNNVQVLYNQFNLLIADLKSSPPTPPPGLSLSASKIIEVDGTPTPYQAGGTFNKARVDGILKTFDPTNNKMPCVQWKEIFSTLGWATKGPDCPDSGGVC